MIQPHRDPVQSITLFLNCLSFWTDFIESQSEFQSMFPLNDSELNPYLTVLVSGSWMKIIRTAFNKLICCSVQYEISHGNLPIQVHSEKKYLLHEYNICMFRTIELYYLSQVLFTR